MMGEREKHCRQRRKPVQRPGKRRVAGVRGGYSYPTVQFLKGFTLCFHLFLHNSQWRGQGRGSRATFTGANRGEGTQPSWRWTGTRLLMALRSDSRSTSTNPLFGQSDGIGGNDSFFLTDDQWLAAAAAAKSLQSCPTLCDPMDCSPPGSSVHGIFQARALEWGAVAYSDQWLRCIQMTHRLCLGGRNLRSSVGAWKNYESPGCWSGCGSQTLLWVSSKQGRTLWGVWHRRGGETSNYDGG